MVSSAGLSEQRETGIIQPPGDAGPNGFGALQLDVGAGGDDGDTKRIGVAAVVEESLIGGGAEGRAGLDQSGAIGVGAGEAAVVPEIKIVDEMAVIFISVGAAKRIRLGRVFWMFCELALASHILSSAELGGRPRRSSNTWLM